LVQKNRESMNNLFKKWNFVRMLRLAMGIFLMVEAIQSGMWLLAAIGAIFASMPLLNIGCCSTGNCSIPTRDSKSSNDEVHYEEIK